MTNKASIQRGRGIYLLPNLLTTGGLFAGFYAIVAAMKGIFDTAAVAIFIAMAADGLDGRVARITNTESAFGAEYDSLADMVAFGVAPTLVVYSWILHYLGKFGWLIAFLYTAAVALRLARFNAQLGSIDKRYFQGLSCTAAAGFMAGLIWIGQDYMITNRWQVVFVAILTLSIAACMVSRIPYRSFKDLDIKGKIPFVMLLIIVLIFVGISIDPPLILFLIFFAYAISGPALSSWHWCKKRRQRKRLQAAKHGNPAS